MAKRAATLVIEIAVSDGAWLFTLKNFEEGR